MSPVEELHALYDQWRQLTEEEGRSIAGEDWPHVAQCQSGKTRLQPRIVEVSQRLESSVHEMHFRPVIEELIQLENANRVRLQSKRQSAEQRRQELDQSSRHLRKLHQSYVPPLRTNWQSYS